MQIDTQRALDKFTSVQNEIYMKQKQNELSSAQFYNDMMSQSRLVMAAMKYQPTSDLQKDPQKSAYTPYTPMTPFPYNKPKEDSARKSVLRGVDTNYMMLPLPNVNTTSKLVGEPSTLLPQHSGPSKSGLWTDTEAIANELDDLIIKF